jgi:DNA-binding LacI/PurR family transcriptional regulator
MKPKRKRFPTMRDVAQQAGVSPATVSFVLSGRSDGASRISEETRQRVLEAVTNLGYIPNATARNLRRQTTERVCLVLPRLGVPYYDPLIQDLQSVAASHGYSVIVSVGGTDEQIEQILRQLRGGLADGLLLDIDYQTGQKFVPFLEELVQTNFPVLVTGNLISGNGFDTLHTNASEATYQGVEYLIKGGHQHIAFIGHHIDNPDEYERYGSYRRALIDNDIPLESQYILAGASTRHEAFVSAQALLALPQPPTAIFCGADIAALSAISAIHAAGQQVPDDIAVMGVGNIPESEVSYPTLTTVGPVERNFRAIADLLFNRLIGVAPADDQQLIQKWELIVREST